MCRIYAEHDESAVDSPGLVGRLVGLVLSYYRLPDGQDLLVHLWSLKLNFCRNESEAKSSGEKVLRF